MAEFRTVYFYCRVPIISLTTLATRTSCDCRKPAESSSLLTGERVHQLRRLHVVQVCGAVPRRRHHLLAPHQPVCGDHHPLVAAQGGRGHAHRGTVVGPLCLAVGLVFVREVPVVLAGCLLLSRREREGRTSVAVVDGGGATSQTLIGSRCSQ